jgi:pantoate--beta-alanine ligase
MQIFREIGPLKAFLVEKRRQGHTFGFVATMGALHEGHLKLLRDSQNDNSITICSIFVNPSQFNNPADLQKYPRTLEKDVLLLSKAGCDALFCPEVETMYDQKSYLRFDFGHLDKVMEGQFRPGHFSGVARVVSKLLHIVEPDIAYFGQKDWQQFAIIRQLVTELKFNVNLKSVPTLREANGLALSSRNARLTDTQREKASLISRTLTKAAEKLRNGMSVRDAKEFITRTLETEREFKVEYVEVADSENLTLLNNVSESTQPIVCIAVFVGEVRLIDNMFL